MTTTVPVDSRDGRQGGEASPPVGRKPQARLSVNMGRGTAEALHDLMEQRETTATETVRRAISLLAYVETERQKGNKFAVLTPSPDGDQVREVILGID